MATDDFWGRFRRWRRTRPFWGGLFLLLSGLELFITANLSITQMEMKIHVGPQGFLSYVLPALLLLCGALVWFTPTQRLFYGIIGLVTALYSFIGLNLGGFFVGMLFGIIGGSLTIAWGPPRVRPGAPLAAPDGSSDDDNTADGPDDADGGPDGPSGRRTDDMGGTRPTEEIEIAGHDDRPHSTPLRAPAHEDARIVPGLGGPAPDDRPGTLLKRVPLNRKALAAILVPVLAAGTVIVGSRLPASAEACPPGLPSRAANSSPSPAGSKAAAAKPAAASKPADKPAEKPAEKPADKPAEKPADKPAEQASASPSATEPDRPILEGVQNVVDGVSNLLGLDEPSSSPSVSPSASQAPASQPPAAGPGTGGKPSVSAPAPAVSKPAAGSPSPTPAASAESDDVPCLGARVQGLLADGTIPRSAIKPGVLKTNSLTLYDSTYEGVADVPTANGTVKALQFNMRKAVNKPFNLTIAEPNGSRTVIKSNELVIENNIRFYTTELKGKLFGLIPVTFSVEQPPPLTLPILWFTDVTIQLAFVYADKLTADPLDLRNAA